MSQIDENALYDNQKFQSFCTLFAKQVDENPSASALIFDGQTFTYSDLEKRSKQIANYLRVKGVTAECIVGLSVYNGLSLVVGMLAILRCGAAYLPIDPNYPFKRIESMLLDASPLFIITDENTAETFAHLASKTILIDKNALFPASLHEISDRKEKILPNQLAYVVYTSGSTGKPKGIMIEHGALAYAAQVHFNLHQKKLISLVSGSIGFDASIVVMTHTLASGGTICILNKSSYIDPGEIISFIRKHQINYTLCVPSFYQLLLSASEVMDSLEFIDVGGENMPNIMPEIHAKFAPNAVFNNIYGPSEYAVGATSAKIYDPITKQCSKITIGKPFDQTEVFILDENLNQVPPDIKGEIFIGGPGLARGYLNNSSLTHEKFPIVEFKNKTPIRLYRTGDFGRFLPDGNLEFLGRIDHQVKIHGNRVELGEIEHVICQHPQVNEAVVIAREGPYEDKQLAVYFTTLTDKEIEQELKIHLAKSLPRYMIPSVFFQIQSFPRTPNGKIDRNVLPTLFKKKKSEAEGSKSEVEWALSEIWKRVLNIDSVSGRDNFFEIGGDSLGIARVQTLIETDLGIEISIAELFQYPTIPQLAQHLATREIKKFTSLSHQEIAKNKKLAFQKFKNTHKRDLT